MNDLFYSLNSEKFIKLIWKTMLEIRWLDLSYLVGFVHLNLGSHQMVNLDI